MFKIKRHVIAFTQYFSLLKQLVKKEQKIKYKRSVLGYAWSVLNPLLTMLVMVMVFSNIFGRNIANFPIYLIIGQLMFGMHSQSSSAALRSITSNASLIQKVYLPKYILTVSSVISSFYNQLFSFIALLIVMIFTGFIPSATTALFFIPLIYQFIFCLGWGMIMATITVFFRDMIHINGILMTLWTYLTPIFYNITALPEQVQRLIRIFNPIYHYVNYLRQLILYGNIPGIRENLICLGYSVLCLLIGVLLFYKKQEKFVEYL